MTNSSLKFLMATILVSVGLISCTTSDRKNENLQPEAQLSDTAAIETPEQAEQSEAHGSEEAAASTHHDHPMVWGYSGVIAPPMWHKLDPSFAQCESGKRQSPIDLKWAQPKDGGEIELNYKEGPVTAIDNGHTLQINFPEGNTARIHGKVYELKQVHFHSASEHTLSGNSLPMEAHFVHKDANGNLAVIGVILIEGASHPAIEQLWQIWPKKKFEEVSAGNFEFRPDSFIPKVKTHYAYSGSLTTPPCSEGVQWIVLNTPVEISGDQILNFRKNYSSNNRPIQKLNGRKVTNY